MTDLSDNAGFAAPAKTADGVDIVDAMWVWAANLAGPPRPGEVWCHGYKVGKVANGLRYEVVRSNTGSLSLVRIDDDYREGERWRTVCGLGQLFSTAEAGEAYLRAKFAVAAVYTAAAGP